MNEHLSPVAPGDFATGERTEPLTPAEQQAEHLEGDLASGLRTKPRAPEDAVEASHHGDFAGGERTEAPDDVVGGFESESE